MGFQTATIILEWVGTFFLAVEAIKLHNLAVIRERLRSVGWRLYPLKNLIKDAPDVGVAEKRFGTVFNLWTLLGFLPFIWAVKYFQLEPEGIVEWTASKLPGFPYRNETMALVLALLAITVAPLIGYLFYRLAVLFLAGFVRALLALENNTANGIVGILGFFLFSVAAIIKLSGFEH